MRAANHAKLAESNTTAQDVINRRTSLQYLQNLEHRCFHGMIEPGSQSIMETAYVKAVIAPFFTNPTTLLASVGGITPGKLIISPISQFGQFGRPWSPSLASSQPS